MTTNYFNIESFLDFGHCGETYVEDDGGYSAEYSTIIRVEDLSESMGDHFRRIFVLETEAGSYRVGSSDVIRQTTYSVVINDEGDISYREDEDESEEDVQYQDARGAHDALAQKLMGHFVSV